jgi:hypothetical protein
MTDFMYKEDRLTESSSSFTASEQETDIDQDDETAGKPHSHLKLCSQSPDHDSAE